VPPPGHEGPLLEPLTVISAFTEEQRRMLWDSVTRALLRLGKAGATEAHAR
jgi:hypothetical protein